MDSKDDVGVGGEHAAGSGGGAHAGVQHAQTTALGLSQHKDKHKQHAGGVTHASTMSSGDPTVSSMHTMSMHSVDHNSPGVRGA